MSMLLLGLKVAQAMGVTRAIQILSTYVKKVMEI